MGESDNPILDRIYSATNTAETVAAYNDWSVRYDADLARFGYRGPPVAMGLFKCTVARDAGAILDAGCGTGLIGALLAGHGYGPLTGIDFSPGMIEAARRKGVYAELHNMKLGDPLDFADGSFAATVSIGVFTRGHVGVEGFPELIRVTRQGGHVIFSLRRDSGIAEPYLAAMAAFDREGRWRLAARTPGFRAIPLVEPDIIDRIYAYEVL